MAGSILVTGGAGYIGSHVVLELLDAGYDVLVLDDLSTGHRAAVPGGVPFHQGDVGDRALLDHLFDDHFIEAVVHLAGSKSVEQSVSDPLAYYRNNTAASATLIEACVRHGVGRLVFSSTAAVYGDAVSGQVTETDPARPVSPYGASKLMTETMLHDAAVAHRAFRSVSLRYFNVAGADVRGRSGERGEAEHLIEAAVATALGRRDRLRLFGRDYPTRDGTCERDYVHVSDIAAAHVAALALLRDGGGGVFNCGYGKGYTVAEVIAAVERVFGCRLSVESAPRRAGDPVSLFADASRLRTATGWTPRHADLDVIIASAAQWRRRLDGPPLEPRLRRGARDGAFQAGLARSALQ